MLHNPDALAPFNKSAHTRATPAGAAGTPLVTEYAAAAFGARIQTSPFGAKKLIADAVDLHHRLPRLDAGTAAGNVRVGHARHVAAATRDLSADEAAWVDQEVHDLTADSPVVRLEGHGPLTIEYVRHLLARVTDLAGPVRVQPVIDLNQTIAVDAYEIPAKLRDAVHLIHPGDVFPYATNTSRAMDLDHAIPYAAGGATSTENLQPLTRTHHRTRPAARTRIKTHHTEPGHQGRGWEVRHPFPGTTIWRDPHGAHYLVDPTGIRTITPTRADDTPTRAEVHATELLLNWAG